MKYIVYESSLYDKEMILFSATIDHITMAKRLNVEDKVTSAGFVYCQDYVNNGVPYCTGKSVTLDKKVADGDNELLAMFLRG